jgi:transcriptional regulator of arginine metabolism
MPKADSDRRSAIEEIVDTEAVSTQEDLRQRLADRGFDVSQSTLSRDIRRLGLVKRPAADGGVFYTRPRTRNVQEAHALGRLLPELLRDVTPAGQLLVIGTLTGAAQTVAAALDDAAWSEIVGTVAGDDTVLVVLRSADSAEAIARRILRLAGRYG